MVSDLKLVVWRDQEDVKGMLGGHKGVRFLLTAQLLLTDAERGLSERYKILDKWLPVELSVGMRGGRGGAQTPFKALLNPVAWEYEALEILLDKEEHLRSVCATVATYLKVASSFGGQQAYEF